MIAQALYTSVYLSPHFDDIALSCGGWAAAEHAAGRRGLCITVFAAPPPPGHVLHAYAQQLHERWGEADPPAANRLRRAEETAALAILGLDPLWLDFADAIYRPAPYDSHAALFCEIAPSEQETLPAAVAAAVADALARTGIGPDVPIYTPLGAGRHADHQIVRAAGLRLAAAGRPLWFYEDYPYAARPGTLAEAVAAVAAQIAPARLVSEVRDVAAYLDTRIAAIAAYASQISSLFPDLAAVPGAVQAYAAATGAEHGLLAAERYWRLEPAPAGVSDSLAGEHAGR